MVARFKESKKLHKTARTKGRRKLTGQAWALHQASEHLERMTTNLLESRTNFLKSLMDPEGRDLDEECGYISDPTNQDYMAFYRRHGIARKVVEVYPDETWAVEPTIYDKEKGTSPFEEKWTALKDRLNIMSELHRLDVNCGICTYGVLYLGYNDVKGVEDLAKPVRGLNRKGRVRDPNIKMESLGNDILFMSSFDETLVTISKYETNLASPRYGLPTEYQICFHDPQNPTTGDSSDGEANAPDPVSIHWTRIIHVPSDSRGSSKIFGSPRMEPVLNQLCDLRKVSGGSAEMFWKGAFPGYSVEVHPDIVESAELDDESVKEQFDRYMNKLQRYLAIVGASVKSLAPQIADPTNHLDSLFRIIACTLNTPMRIFTGSEAAHLASSQDGITWNRRIMKRQQVFVNPFIIRPFVDRLILTGVLPKVKQYKIDWIDLNAMTAGDMADVALKKTQALMQYVSGGAELVMPPMEYFTTILGLSMEQADMVMKEVTKAKKKLTKEFWEKPAPAAGGMNTTGSKSSKMKNPTKKTNQNRNADGSKV